MEQSIPLLIISLQRWKTKGLKNMLNISVFSLSLHLNIVEVSWSIQKLGWPVHDARESIFRMQAGLFPFLYFFFHLCVLFCIRGPTTIYRRLRACQKSNQGNRDLLTDWLRGRLVDWFWQAYLYPWKPIKQIGNYISVWIFFSGFLSFNTRFQITRWPSLRVPATSFAAIVTFTSESNIKLTVSARFQRDRWRHPSDLFASRIGCLPFL